MNEFKIEKGVPLPGVNGKRSRYPWKDMSPGESVFLPGRRISAAAPGDGPIITTGHPGRSVPGTKWAMRTVTENGVSGVRVWRTA